MEVEQRKKEEYYDKRRDLLMGICSLLDGCSVSIAEGILNDAMRQIKNYAIDFDKPDCDGDSWVIYSKPPISE